MRPTENTIWTIGLIAIIGVGTSIAVVANDTRSRLFDELNALLDENNALLDENNALLVDSNAKLDELGNKIDASGEKIVAAFDELGVVLVEAIQSTWGNSRQKSDSPSESLNMVENTPQDSFFPIVADKNQEVYLNLTEAIEEIGLVPNSEALSPVILISLNNKHSEEHLTKILALSSVPIVKESFVTFDKNSKEYPLFWSILSPSVVPSRLEGAPLTISYAIIN